MLSTEHRLRSSDDFRRAVRRGRKAGGDFVVAHLLRANVDKETASPALVGVVVAKSVGPAVVRNRVKRRLRHQMRERVGRLPEGGMLVVRALPRAAGVGSDELGADLDRCLSRCLGEP